MKVLGQGGFGKVLLAAQKSANRFHWQGKLCAVKVMEKRDIVLRGYYENVKTEKEILTQVYGCPFLISFYGSFQTEVSCLFLNSY
jgi:serine/threonine protein kinase